MSNSLIIRNVPTADKWYFYCVPTGVKKVLWAVRLYLPEHTSRDSSFACAWSLPVDQSTIMNRLVAPTVGTGSDSELSYTLWRLMERPSPLEDAMTHAARATSVGAIEW